VQINDRVRCQVPRLHLDFIGRVTEVKPGGVIFVQAIGENCFVLTHEENVTPVPKEMETILSCRECKAIGVLPNGDPCPICEGTGYLREK